MLEKNDNFIIWIDVLRIFCCFCIILLHVSGMMTDFSYIGYRLIQAIVRPALWTFLSITGFLVIGGKKIKDYKLFVLKHILSLLIPAIVYLFFYNLYLNNTIMYNPYPYIFNMPVGHLWYIYALIVLYFVMPFIQSAFNSLSERQLILMLAVILVFNRLNDILYAFGKTIAFDLTLVGNIYIYYLGIGFFFRRYYGMIRQEIGKVRAVKIGGGLVFCSCGLTCWESVHPILVNKCYNLSLGMTLGGLAFFILFSEIEIKNDAIRNKIHYISNRMYGVFLVHMLFLWILRDYYPVGNGKIIIQTKNVIVLSVGVFVSSLVFAIVIDFVINLTATALRKMLKNVGLKERL